MKHFGDITKIDGHKVPLVDIITAGSPCQDLSIAGKRAGLQGERSGLFMEQIRIIKEMHDESRRTNKSIRPRFLVWENVTGALSSKVKDDGIVQTLNGRMGTGGNNVPMLLLTEDHFGDYNESETAASLRKSGGTLGGVESLW